MQETFEVMIVVNTEKKKSNLNIEPYAKDANTKLSVSQNVLGAAEVPVSKKHKVDIK